MLFDKYEPETISLYKKIVRPGMTIIDIGAHIGYFTRIGSRLIGKNGKVIAFEANPSNFALLKKNTKSMKNVFPHEFAVADKKGTMDFYHYEEKSGVGSILPNVPLDFKKTKISVLATDLDSFLEKGKVQKIDVIKMDIEGGESAALLGMKNLLAGTSDLQMIIEFAPAWVIASGNSPIAFLNYIESFGFEISAITAEGLKKMSPMQTEKDYAEYIPRPKDGSHFGEFVNLYCVKNVRG
ncbi:FkbM family methyltransferase [Candidatus Giovannonibacteria bacterium]|nr:FkbM family methyltransferase [Candidatus Giovannonibacteria bacterium]